MKTPNTCLTRTIHAPGFGSAASPAPAIGHGIAMPTPRKNGSASATRRAGRVEVAREEHDLDHDRRDARAGQQRRDGAHAEGERRTCRGPLPPTRTLLENREKSITMTSNIASASDDEQHGDAEVEPRRRVDGAERAGGQNDDRGRARRRRAPSPRRRRAPSRKPRLREPACAPAPMIARLIGIIGSTHGVRFSARPPRRTISRMASGPRPSKSPLS